MANDQYVTLVAAGGTPVRIATQSGTPYPTTGTGALVFANGPTLNNPILTGIVSIEGLPVVVPSVDALISLTAASPVVLLEAYYEGGTTGGGMLIYVQGATDTVDNGYVFDAPDGRYFRVVNGVLCTDDFGILKDGTEGQGPRMQEWINTCVRYEFAMCVSSAPNIPTGYINCTEPGSGLGATLYVNLNGTNTSGPTQGFHFFGSPTGAKDRETGAETQFAGGSYIWNARIIFGCGDDFRGGNWFSIDNTTCLTRQATIEGFRLKGSISLNALQVGCRMSGVMVNPTDIDGNTGGYVVVHSNTIVIIGCRADSGGLDLNGFELESTSSVVMVGCASNACRHAIVGTLKGTGGKPARSNNLRVLQFRAEGPRGVALYLSNMDHPQIEAVVLSKSSDQPVVDLQYDSDGSTVLTNVVASSWVLPDPPVTLDSYALEVGLPITGTNIAANTTIESWTADTITLSQVASGAGTAQTGYIQIPRIVYGHLSDSSQYSKQIECWLDLRGHNVSGSLSFLADVTTDSTVLTNVTPDPTTTFIAAGLDISGKGISDVATVVSWTSNTITISEAATLTLTQTAVGVDLPDVEFVGDVTADSDVLTNVTPDPTTVDIGAGYVVRGLGVPSGSEIVSFDATSITISTLGTITNTGVALTASSQSANLLHSIGVYMAHCTDDARILDGSSIEYFDTGVLITKNTAVPIVGEVNWASIRGFDPATLAITDGTAVSTPSAGGVTASVPRYTGLSLAAQNAFPGYTLLEMYPSSTRGTARNYSYDDTSPGGGSYWSVARASGTFAAPAVVVNGDIIGGMDWYVFDGDMFVRSAALRMSMEETTPGPTALGMKAQLRMPLPGNSSQTTVLDLSGSTGLKLLGLSTAIQGVSGDVGTPVKTVAVGANQLPAAASYTSRIFCISDPAGGKAPLVISDGSNWLYMDGTVAL